MTSRRLSGLYFLLIAITGLTGEAFAQDTARIWLDRADSWEYDRTVSPDAQRIKGDVILRHDSAYLYCDSAYLNEDSNTVTAYGRVHIRNSDTLNLYGDSLTYNGNTRIARVWSNVKLIDNQTVLTTDTLVYDRKTGTASYDYWGKIVNDKNILISKHGKYYTEVKEFFFRHKVNLINPDYRMFSDTLKYNTVSETAFFTGPSHIISEDRVDSIWCTDGWYDTRYDICRFTARAVIYHADQYITGDSMYYERKTGYGQVFRNALLADTTQDILLTGHYGELHRKRGFAFMTDSAVAILAEEKDSLFMHADTIRGTFDSAQHVRDVFAFYGVRFFRKDLQGICDSMVYHGSDSSMMMYHDPVLWSDENQLTGDSVNLAMRNNQLDTMAIYSNAFIIAMDDSSRFNQIKGREMAGYFAGNELYKVKVNGNAETVYYMREEDKTLIGVLKAVSGNMQIFITNRKLQDITFLDQPEGVIYPEKDLSPYDARLRGFSWQQEKRPISRQDIFRRSVPTAP